MKAVWTVITVLLLINVLLLAGGVGWLFKTGRLDQERFDRARDMFTKTIAEEKRETEQAKELEEQARQRAEEIARLESVSDGPVTLADRLQAELRGDDLAAQRVERLKRDIKDLRRQLALAKQLINQQHEDLAAQRQAFKEAVEAETKLKEDEDFQQTVRLYENVKAKQAKQMFQQLMGQNKVDEVVDYLSAMQQRKAAAVLKQFKSPPEIAQATVLLQRLRERGIEMDQPGSPGQNRPNNGLDQNEAGQT